MLNRQIYRKTPIKPTVYNVVRRVRNSWVPPRREGARLRRANHVQGAPVGSVPTTQAMTHWLSADRPRPLVGREVEIVASSHWTPLF